MVPAVSPAPAPRSVLITVLGCIIALGAAVLSVISFFALLMILVGGDGTQTKDASGFFLVVVAPPLTAVAGVGLALRWRWAWYYLVGGLAAALLWNAAQLMRPAQPPVTTTVSPSGTITTTYHSGPMYSLPVIVLATGALCVLLLPRARREFTSPCRPAPPQAHAVG